MNADRIATKLWMGAYPKIDMCDGRFGLIVLAAIERPDLPFGCRGQGVVRVPLDDIDAPMEPQDIALAIKAAETVNAARRRGIRVLVSCNMGVNRSGLVTAMALVLEGMSPDSAIALVRTKRRPRTTDLEPLCNDEFVRVVRALGKRRRVA